MPFSGGAGFSPEACQSERSSVVSPLGEGSLLYGIGHDSSGLATLYSFAPTSPRWTRTSIPPAPRRDSSFRTAFPPSATRTGSVSIPSTRTLLLSISTLRTKTNAVSRLSQEPRRLYLHEVGEPAIVADGDFETAPLNERTVSVSLPVSYRTYWGSRTRSEAKPRSPQAGS